MAPVEKVPFIVKIENFTVVLRYTPYIQKIHDRNVFAGQKDIIKKASLWGEKR